MEKPTFLCCWEESKWCSHHAEQYWGSSKFKNRTIVILLLRFCCASQGNKIRALRRYCTPVVTAVLFTTAQIQKQTCGHRQKNGYKIITITVYMHSMEFYASLKTIGNLPFSATGINLEDIIRSERSQSHRMKYWMIPPRRVSKFVTRIVKKPGCGELGEGGNGAMSTGRYFSSCELK